MPILAAHVEGIIGVDTHRDMHVAAACHPTGGLLAQAQACTRPAGLAELLAFGRAQVPDRRGWAIEGCGSYGRDWRRSCWPRGRRSSRSSVPPDPSAAGRTKSDPVDAARAAREALGTETGKLAEPKQGAPREALRVVMAARASVIEARKAALNLLHHLRVTAPGELREHLRDCSGHTMLDACTSLPDQLAAHADAAARTTAATLAHVAARIHSLAAEEADYDRQLRDLVAHLAPSIVAEPGAGPVSTAQMILSYGHHGRVATEAAFSQLAGASPVEASSGQKTRHRLNRGGDRQLNRALHTIALARMNHDSRTRAYVARRRAEGKTDREIRRCIKRYLARHFHRKLRACPLPAA